MKTVIMAFGVVLLCACAKPPSEWTAKAAAIPNIKGLEDCTVFEMNYNITVIRCPNSSTTTSHAHSCGKNCTKRLSNTVVDESNPEKTCDQTKVYTQEEADNMCMEKVQAVMGFKQK